MIRHTSRTSATSSRRCLLVCSAAALCCAELAMGAPKVTRLTPPSALFTFNDPEPPYISRFLPGQRFDLQATIAPDAGQTISAVQFFVDGTPVAGPVTIADANATTNVNDVVASVRAYANPSAGVHTLTVAAVQSDAQTVTTNGNFEIVPIRATGAGAKNIIILIGDGMGIAHRTAARIMRNGASLGKANAVLIMDTFPFTGIVMTHSLNSIVTDSSPGASCYATGNKANNNQHGVFPDDTSANFDNPRIESIGEYLRRTQGRSLGIVSTADLFDSTPAAFGSHTQARAASTGIIDQMFDERASLGLTVLLGGGRKWFLPNTVPGSGRQDSQDYVLPSDVVAGWGVPAGAIDPGRDLISEFIGAGYTYVGTKTALDAIPTETEKLLGLFSLSNMSVAKDKIDKRRNPGAQGVVDEHGFPDQPMLDEMTDKALQILSRNPNGFVAMIEGASIDKQAHLMDSDRWIVDTIEFDRAIERCRKFAEQHPDTLVIVTADHECGGANIIGASRVTNAELVDRADDGLGTNRLRNGVVGTLDGAGFPTYQLSPDGYPVTTDINRKMLIGYACNADRHEDWLFNPRPTQNASHGVVLPVPGAPAPLLPHPKDPVDRDQAGNMFILGHISDTIATHTASDIPLSAFGRNAALFTGVMDNTDVFFKVMQSALGDPGTQAQFHRAVISGARGETPDDLPEASEE